VLATIGLILTVVSVPSYVFTMEVPALRSSGVVLFGVAGLGLVIGLISLKGGGVWRKVALALNVAFVATLVYGFFFLTKLPDANVAHDAARVPDFVLPDQNGVPVSLAKLRARGPVHLVFYRGHW
jgi:hypothetical protein